MLNQNHPDDERLSALASRDADATDDATLTAHVSSCDRCTGLVDELGELRLALSELPDLAPARPLQLIPPVAASEPTTDRVGGWARRFFAPVLASGAALALIGVIGTAAPALDNLASGQGGADSLVQERVAAPAGSEAAAEAGGDVGTIAGGSPSAQRDISAPQPSDGDGAEAFSTDETAANQSPPAAAGEEDFTRSALEEERSPWPMVLFVGVALMIGAVVTRWILAPRAG
jgi:hypothetical protein